MLCNNCITSVALSMKHWLSYTSAWVGLNNCDKFAYLSTVSCWLSDFACSGWAHLHLGRGGNPLAVTWSRMALPRWLGQPGHPIHSYSSSRVESCPRYVLLAVTKGNEQASKTFKFSQTYSIDQSKSPRTAQILWGGNRPPPPFW